MAERKLTVRVDLQAGGDLEKRLDTASGKADQLKAKTDAAGRMPPSASVPGPRVPPTSPRPQVIPSVPPTSPRIPLTPGGGGVGGDTPRISSIFSTVSRFGAGLGLASASLGLLTKVMDRLGDQAVLAANSLERITQVRAGLSAQFAGQALSRERYEQMLPASLRTRLEAAAPEDRTQILQGELTRLRETFADIGPEQQAQGASVRGAQVQAALERVRSIPFADTLNPFTGGRERQRVEALRESSGFGGQAFGEIMRQLRGEGLGGALGEETLTNQQIARIAGIVGGRESVEGRVNLMRGLQEVLQRGVPGIFPTQEQLQPTRFTGAFQSGEFYMRLVEAIGRPEEQDMAARQFQMLQLINGTLVELRDRFPPRPNP